MISKIFVQDREFINQSIFAKIEKFQVVLDNIITNQKYWCLKEDCTYFRTKDKYALYKIFRNKRDLTYNYYKTYLNVEEFHCLDICKIDAKCVGGQYNYFDNTCMLIETFNQDYEGKY